MAGLLDIFDTEEGRLGLGLLMAAAPRADRTGFGDRLGDAFGFVERSRLAKQDRADKAEERAMRQQLQAAQIGNYQSEAAARAAAVGREQKRQDFLSGGNLDPMAMLRSGLFKPEEIQAIAGVPNAGRAKVARTIEVAGPDGSKKLMQVDEFGAPVGDALPGYTAPQLVNLGNRQVFATPQAGAAFDVGMSPAERDASARGWAGNAIAQQRLALDRSEFGPNGSKAPAGYRWKSDGTLEAIPGGPAGEGKPLTESQGKSTTYLGQMQAASRELAGLSSMDVKPSPIAVGMAGNNLVNWATSKGAQQVAQAQNQWAEAYLRAKTGAAATEKEVEINRKTYFPQPGDSAVVIAQKERMRAQAEHDLRAQIGQGDRFLGSATPKPAGKVWKFVNGQLVQE